uniref:Phosphoacetylglucosamine mutase n=1 Tax=Acrobeloides nanus TaxID=290746 RepID=A0A914CD55_9BILA
MGSKKVAENFTRAGNVNFNGNFCPVLQDKKFRYGTAGFRYPNEEMTFIAFRIGFLASLRARSLNQVVGVMVTASHNPTGDNGVKIIEPTGHMLENDWEHLATELVNANDTEFEELASSTEKSIMEKTGLKTETIPDNAKIFIGSDTRDSSPWLMRAVARGAEFGRVLKVNEFVNFTTPQLHYIVYATNKPNLSFDRLAPVRKTTDAFFEFIKRCPSKQLENYKPSLIVDCANGVGALWVLEYLNHPEQKNFPMNITLKNDAKDAAANEYLNRDCGADFVKLWRTFPRGFKNVPSETRCAALDGDADRLVYFYSNNNGVFILLDGDQIAALYAKFLIKQLELLGAKDLSIGVVQTAYANGNSSRYFRSLGIEPAIVATGVKNLHPKSETYDIGIYFEANGHGTVTFSEKFWDFVKETPADPEPKIMLRLFSQIINDIVGDGIADLFAVEAILRYFDWSIGDWASKIYTDVPSAQLKIPFRDRSIFQTTPDETRLIKPEVMQKEIDVWVSKFHGARAFVRPSGTEPIVRIYAEADTDENALHLAYRIAHVVDKNYPIPFELPEIE